MKLLVVAGPPSSGKTSVILQLISALGAPQRTAGVVKFDCLTSFDHLRSAVARLCPLRRKGRFRLGRYRSDPRPAHGVRRRALQALCRRQKGRPAVGGEVTRTQRERRIALSEAAPWRSKSMDCAFSVPLKRNKTQKMSNKRKAQKASKPA